MKNLIIFLFLFMSIINSYGQLSPIEADYLKKIDLVEEDTAKARLYNTLANSVMRSNSYQANLYAEKAFELAQKKHDEKLVAEIQATMGIVAMMQANYKQALNLYFKYLAFCKSTNNTVGEIKAYSNIGSIYYLAKSPQKALDSYRKAIQIEEKTKQNSLKMASIYNNIANIYIDLEQFNNAVYYFKKALVVAKANHDTQNQGITYNNWGKLLFDTHEYENAFTMYTRAIELRKQTNDSVGLGRTYFNLIQYYAKLGEKTKLLSLSQNTLSLLERCKDFETKKNLLFFLYEYYENQQNWERALYYHKVYLKQNEILITQGGTAQLEQIEQMYAYEERENQVLLENNKMKFKFILLFTVLFFIIIIVTLLFLLQKNRYTRLMLLQRNLELEASGMQTNLEIKDKELTTNALYLVKNNELINSICSKLVEISNSLSFEKQQELQPLIIELQKSGKNDAWREFEVRFENVHQDFYQRLTKLYPDISPNELKLCAFLRLNMSTKDIAVLLQKSEKSIAVARTRLRKRMRLTNSDVEIVNFLAQI